MLTTTALALALLQDPTAAPDIDWRTDLEAARQEALETDRPLLAVFRCEP